MSLFVPVTLQSHFPNTAGLSPLESIDDVFDIMILRASRSNTVSDNYEILMIPLKIKYLVARKISIAVEWYGFKIYLFVVSKQR